MPQKRIKGEKRSIDEVDSSKYDEWAKQLANRPIPPLQATSGSTINSSTLLQAAGIHLFNSTNTNNTNLNAPNLFGEDGLPPHSGFDMDSAIGRFSWHTFEEEKNIPCIFRSGKEYCSVRMAEKTILASFFRALPIEICDGIHLESFYITVQEAKLLNYINSWHCDSLYGAEQFSVQDLIVSKEDLQKYYDYLAFSYSVLSTGGKNINNDFSKCGFVKVNDDSLIPYTVLPPTDKAVPLFYFEGQIDILNAQSQDITGWELAYLKLCCKVQGVRKELISFEKLRIVKLTELKGYFPKRTTFSENNWPTAKSKSLLPKATFASMNQFPVPSGCWTRPSGIEGFSTDKSNAATLTQRAIVSGISSYFTPSTPVHSTSQAAPTVSVSSGNGILTSQFLSNSNGSGGGNSLSSINNLSSSIGVTRVSSMSSVPTSTLLPALQSSAALNANRASTTHPTRTINVSKIKVTSQPADVSKLLSIPEYPDGYREGAYSIRMIIIEKEVMHCINQRPFKSDGYLLVLQEFMIRLFSTPAISIYPTVISVLKTAGISCYLPNKAQIKAFNAFGFTIQNAWELPLIQATDAASQLSKLKLLLTPKPTSGISRPPALAYMGQNVTVARMPTQQRVVSNGYTTYSSSGRAR